MSSNLTLSAIRRHIKIETLMKIVFALFTLLLFPYILYSMSNDYEIILESSQHSCSWCNKRIKNETTPLLEQQDQYCMAAWDKNFPKHQCLHCKQDISDGSSKKYVFCTIGKYFEIHEACEQEFINSLKKLLLCSYCRKKISVNFTDYCGLGKDRFLKCAWFGFYLTAFTAGALTTYIFVVWSPSAPAWMTNLID